MPVVLVLWTAFFLINFNIAMMIPLLPFIQAEIRLTPTEVGLMLAAFSVAALFTNLALGPFIDRYGRRRFLVTGALGVTVTLLLTAAADSAWPIILARIATGFFMPMVGASIFAALADYVPLPQRARVAGYVTSAAPVAFLAAISMGVLLGGLVEWRLPVIGLALIALALAFGAARLPPPPPGALATGRVTARTYRDLLLSLSLDRTVRLLLLSYLVWSMALFTLMGLYPSWLLQVALAGYGTGAVGTMLLVAGLGGLIGALLAGRVARAFAHPLAPCALASAVMALVSLAIPVSGGMALQAMVYFVFAFARDMMLALTLVGAMALVPPTERGSLNSIMNALFQTGASLAGLASAWLYALRPDYWANALVAAALMAGTAAMLASVARGARRG